MQPKGVWLSSHGDLREQYWNLQWNPKCTLVISIRNKCPYTHTHKYTYSMCVCVCVYIYIQYFPAHKTHRDFFVRNFRKK